MTSGRSGIYNFLNWCSRIEPGELDQNYGLWHIPQWEWIWMTLTLEQCLGTVSEISGWCEPKSCQSAWKIMNENRRKVLGPFFFFTVWVYFYSLIRIQERKESIERRELSKIFIIFNILQSFIILQYSHCFTRKKKKLSSTSFSTSPHFNVSNWLISHLKFLLVTYEIFLTRTQKHHRN